MEHKKKFTDDHRHRPVEGFFPCTCSCGEEIEEYLGPTPYRPSWGIWKTPAENTAWSKKMADATLHIECLENIWQVREGTENVVYVGLDRANCISWAFENYPDLEAGRPMRVPLG